MRNGEKVYVSGEVEWGNRDYRIATIGIIEDWEQGSHALVTVDNIDGDPQVCTLVNKKYISKAI